jgi:citrate synthase
MASEPDHPFVQKLPVILRAGRDLFGLFPNIDFALAAMQKTYDLPRDSGKIIFCAGRMAGWIAHALEQYAAQEQIRPRATYVGIRSD